MLTEAAARFMLAERLDRSGIARRSLLVLGGYTWPRRGVRGTTRDRRSRHWRAWRRMARWQRAALTRGWPW